MLACFLIASGAALIAGALGVYWSRGLPPRDMDDWG